MAIPGSSDEQRSILDEQYSEMYAQTVFPIPPFRNVLLETISNLTGM
jgi:hypothetical protein